MPRLTPLDEARTDIRSGSDQLTIRISSGSGSGRTRLSAFDSALSAAGVADFNLLRLSSVIPPGAAVVEVDRQDQLHGGFGDRLFCVYAVAYASTPLEEAWAGMAWSRRRDRSGAGLFVEHDGASSATVRHDLEHSLADLGDDRGGDFEPAGLVLASAQCLAHPVCAVVIATYRSADWSRFDA